jgi:hypothetical protein
MAAALRADKASGPISDGKISAVARGLFAGIDVNMAPATVAPCAQQQIGFGRRAERRRPRRAFEAFPPHGVPVPYLPLARAHEMRPADIATAYIFGGICPWRARTRCDAFELCRRRQNLVSARRWH